MILSGPDFIGVPHCFPRFFEVDEVLRDKLPAFSRRCRGWRFEAAQPFFAVRVELFPPCVV